nr:SGNH hydrolase-type esterase domain-containing protein [Tanacetum cinerariifolium]
LTPPGTFGVAIGTTEAATGTIGVATVTPIVDLAVFADSPQVPPGASNKGKSLMIEEDIPVPARTFRKMEEDRLGEEVARRLHEEELAEMEREQEEA